MRKITVLVTNNEQIVHKMMPPTFY